MAVARGSRPQRRQVGSAPCTQRLARENGHRDGDQPEDSSVNVLTAERGIRGGARDLGVPVSRVQLYNRSGGFEFAAIRGTNLTGLFREGLERPTGSATPGGQATDQFGQGSLPRMGWRVQFCQPQTGPRRAPLPHTHAQHTCRLPIRLRGFPLWEGLERPTLSPDRPHAALLGFLSQGGIGASNPSTEWREVRPASRSHIWSGGLKRKWTLRGAPQGSPGHTQWANLRAEHVRVQVLAGRARWRQRVIIVEACLQFRCSSLDRAPPPPFSFVHMFWPSSTPFPPPPLVNVSHFPPGRPAVRFALGAGRSRGISAVPRPCGLGDRFFALLVFFLLIRPSPLHRGGSF